MFRPVSWKWEEASGEKRATNQTRTGDLRVTNALLYRLSYSGLYY